MTDFQKTGREDAQHRQSSETRPRLADNSRSNQLPLTDLAAPSNPPGLSAGHLLGLHRAVGNAAVTRLLRQHQMHVQRVVVDDADDKKVVLRRGMQPVEMITAVSTYLRDKKVELVTGANLSDADLMDMVGASMFASGSGALDVINGTKPMRMTDFIEVIRKSLELPTAQKLLEMARAGRGAEIKNVQQTLETTRAKIVANQKATVTREAVTNQPAQTNAPNLLPLQSHDEALEEKKLRHFAEFDQLFNANMLWRFTSTPSSEFVKIDAGVGMTEILQVIANHSGGNDKSNTRVITLSFGRNIAALLGIALSPGGDKQVVGIISRTPYLYGIDIASLKGKGITAHPARSRAISLFETEYVLVPVPGAAPVGLNELATVKYTNPFKGMGRKLVEETGTPTTVAFYDAAQEKLNKKKITPEVIKDPLEMPTKTVDALLSYAKLVAKAAQPFAGNVMIKDPFPPEKYAAMLDMIDQFLQALEKLQATQKTQ